MILINLFCFAIPYIKDAMEPTISATLSAVFLTIFLVAIDELFPALIIASAEQTASVALTPFIMFLDVFVFIFSSTCAQL